MIESIEQFVALRTSEKSEDYQRAAYEEAPLHVWEGLVENHPEMRFWVAQNKTVPISILNILANDSDPIVRDMVARKRQLPEELQLKLAGDTDESVRNALVNNAKVTEKALTILSTDPWEEVRKKAKEKLNKLKKVSS